MNKPYTPDMSVLRAHVLLALALIGTTGVAQAACSDNGDGTYTCSGDAENNATSLFGTVILDNAGGSMTLTNETTDPHFPATIDNSSSSPAAAATLVTNGNGDVVVNNIGSSINFNGGGRMFDPAGWANDALGLLYNGGVLAGYGAAINADSGTASLTVNNLNVDNGIYYPDLGLEGIQSYIQANGNFSASIYTNAPQLTVNNTGYLWGEVVSFAGATYTPPAVLDGTQQATGVTPGLTVINNTGMMGGIRIVDRNPLLTAAQAADPSLMLAYGPDDVGPRNSIINNNGLGQINGDIHLGSGAHVINNIGEYDPLSGGRAKIQGNIYVDQTDGEIVDVSGGVATTLYKVHGDRTFTFNQDGDFNGNVVINDVAGAVNTINYSLYGQYLYNNFTANGLGDNTLNMHCYGRPDGAYRCQQVGIVSGFTEYNLTGNNTEIVGNIDVTGDINLNTGVSLFPQATLTAANVVIGSGGFLADAGKYIFDANASIGKINGNLVNNGTVRLSDATLDISGNASMNSGSNLVFLVGSGIPPALNVAGVISPASINGKLNVQGTAQFADGSWVTPTVETNVLVRDGQRFTVATNAAGIPLIRDDGSFLQWDASIDSGDLVLTADMRVPDALKPQVSLAAGNALEGLFSYQGDGELPLALQAQMQRLQGIDAVRAVERLRPEINDGAIRMVLRNTDKVFDILNTRMLDSYLARNNAFGVAVSNDGLVPGKGIWIQGFGDRGQQDRLNDVDGYDASSAGIAAGADRELQIGDGSMRVGFAFGYARGNITNDGYTVNNRIDTNSYLAAAYGSRSWDDWYLNAAAGFGRNTYETRRQLFEHTATGSHDSWQFSTRFEAGWPLLFNDNMAFVPLASFDYSHIKESDYRENGKVVRAVLDRSFNPPQPVTVNGVPQFATENSPINLDIESRTFDSYRAGIGGKFIYAIQEPGWGGEIELRALYRHEFGDIAQNSTARFALGGDSFRSPGLKPARGGIVLGGSVRLAGADEGDQITLLTSYDADIREEYFGQTMSLSLRYDFDQGPRYTEKAMARLATSREKAAASGKTIAVTATESDIAAIQQAMQSGTLDDGEDLSPEDALRQQAVNAAIQGWAAALSNKNLDAYFGSYAANFLVPDGSTRQQWERRRRSEITHAGNPVVRISYLTIKPMGEQAMAVFTQTTTREGHEEVMQKIVDFEHRNGRWLIVREDSLALPEM